MVDAESLKKEIDTIETNDKIEIQEMEEFLKSEENIKKLGEAMDSSASPELLQEFETVLKDLCEKFLNLDELTNNQEQILNYFLDKFEVKYPEILNGSLDKFGAKYLGGLCERIISKKNINDISLNQYKTLKYYSGHCNEEQQNGETYRKVQNVLRKLDEEYKKDLKKYDSGKGERPHGVVAQYLDEIQQEQADRINKINEYMNEQIRKMPEIFDENFKENQEKERRNKLLSRREKDKNEIEPLLQKEGELSEEEKAKLINFRNFYYNEGHIQYEYNGQYIDRLTSNQLTSELGGKGLTTDIVGYDEIANEIDKKLNAGIFSTIENIINQQKLPKDIEGLRTVNEWINKYGKNNSQETQVLLGLLNNEINQIIKQKFTRGNINNENLNSREIGIFQLYANTNYDENLEITGNRGRLPFGKDKNQEITNLYIYRLQISSRNLNIVKIPNIDEILGKLGTKEKEHTIFKNFMTFFLNIRKTGLMFENKIGSKVFEDLLNNMISSEIYRGINIPSEIKKREFIKKYAKEGSEIYSQCEQMINGLNQIKGTEDLGEYYENFSKEQENLIKKQNENNIEEYNISQLNKSLNNITKKISNLPKLELPTLKEKATKEEKKEWEDKCNRIKSEYDIKYKDAYQKIAIDFINLRRQPKYKKYLKDNILSSQIFIQIYSLWKDEIGKKFGTDVEKECNRYRELLDSFSNNENRKIERIVDTYSQVNEANKNIEEKNGERKEEHFDTNPTRPIITESRYITAQDQVARTLGRQPVPGGQEITMVSKVHRDSYLGNRYQENHDTPVQTITKCLNGETITHDLVQNHNPSDTMVPPDSDNWYAILSNSLKQKANQGKIKLAIINDVACVYEFSDGQYIKIWEFDKKTKKLKPKKTITAEEYTRAITIEDNRSKVREAEHGEEYKKIQNELKAIMEKNDDVNALFAERQNQDLDKIELKQLQAGAIKLYDMTKDFSNPNTKEKLKNLKISLKKLNQNSNKYENPYERQIREYIENIDGILRFVEDPEQIKKVEEFKDFCLNHADNNETFWARWKERLPMALAFIASIAIIVVSCGSLSILGVAALSAATGIVVREGTTIALNQRTGNGSITVNGIEYKTHYTNPTLIEQAFDPKSETTFRDCVKGYGSEFITSTLLQAGLMRTGGQFSQYISKMIAKAPAGSFARKSADLVCKVLCKERLKGDTYTEGIIKSVEKQVSKEGFIKRFGHELAEETREESVEQAAEKQGAVLGAIATFIHCIKPHPGQSLQLAGVGHPKIEQPISMGKGKSKLIAQATYDGTNPDNITILKNYYESIPEYKDKVSIQEGGIIKISATNIKGGEVEIDGEKIQTNMDIELEFHPSKAPLAIRNLPTELNNLGSLNVNEETGQVSYGSKVRLRVLGKYLKSQGLGSVKLNNDGTAILNIGKNEIRLSKDESYFEGKSHWFNITTVEAISNSKEMDNLISEINEDNKQKKLQDLREKINKEYKIITGAEEDLNLTNEQLHSIIEAHKQEGELGNLNQSELGNKENILSETIKDHEVRRFLLEAGFCGKINSTIDLREKVTQEWKNKTQKKLIENQGKISDAEKALDFWAEGEGGKYADMKMDFTKAKEKIDKARKALEDWINGTGKQYNSIEEFLEEHQLGLNEGKTKIEKEIIKDGEENLTRSERYQLGLDDPETKTETKKRKKMQDKSKMLLTRLYYESIFKPLGLEIFADPHLTLGNNVDNQTFLDTQHYSENFEEFSENEKFGFDENRNKTPSKAEKIGDKIIEQIAVNEGRNKLKSSEGKIEDTVSKEIESITDVTEKKIAKELWASIQAHAQGKISIEDQAYLFGMTMKHLADLRTAYPNLNPKQVFDLLNSNQNKLLHQHLRDINTITSSDHGIKHILRGNATLAENVFSQLDEKGTREKLYNQVDEKGKLTIRKNNESLDQFKARMKVLTRQAIIDHDLGYTNKVNQAFDIKGFGKGFRMVSDHPLRSTIRVENNQSFYTDIFGEDGYNAIRESLPGHGSAQTQNISKILNGTATETDFVRGILSNVDCAGSPADYKIAHMFAQSGMIGGLFNAYKLLNNGDIVGAKQQLTNLIKTINDMQVTGELSGIKESRTKGIEAFLANKNFENMEPDKLKDVFGFHFNKFLGAFGIMTSIDPETGKANIGINENGGWGAEFNLAGKSFELIADSFGAGTALKSFIGVCDDYGINDKGPTSKFLESQFKKAIKDWKNRKLKEQPLIDFIKQRLNPDSSTYKSDLDEFVAEFNRKGSKELKDGWEEVRVGKDLKFEKNIHKKDGSRERVTEPWIGFSTEGITIHGGNNVEITLNFEGNSYEGFDAIVNNINIIDSEIQENIDKLKENKINPEGIEAILPDIQNNLTALLELLNDTPGLDITDFETILNRINLLNEGERSTTNDGICRLTTYKNGTVDEIMNLDDFINEINKLKSACKYMITKVHGSNPSINN